MSIFTYTIPDNIFDRCTNHAKVYSQSLVEKYSKRGQCNPTKIRQDMRNGLIGEVGAWVFLEKEYGRGSATQPYLLKLDGSNMRDDFYHNSDIIVNDRLNIHVKTQESKQAERFGSAWVFQRSHVHELEKKNLETHLVLFGEFNEDTLEYQVKVFEPLSMLFVRNMFKDMKIQRYNVGKNAKYSVHFEDFYVKV
jgi:hypothetical protein